MEIQVERPWGRLVKKAWLKEIVLTLLEAEKVGGRVTVGVLLTGDETIQALNRSYRGRDEVTDVLSFPLEPESFPTPPGQLPYLGEVAISVPQAKRQAEEAGHSLDQEVAHLLVHGLLHILGYDHEEEEDAQRMEAKEAEILNLLPRT